MELGTCLLVTVQATARANLHYPNLRWQLPAQPVLQAHYTV